MVYQGTNFRKHPNGWHLGPFPTTGALATVPFSCSAPHRCGSEVSRGGEVCGDGAMKNAWLVIGYINKPL